MSIEQQVYEMVRPIMDQALQSAVRDARETIRQIEGEELFNQDEAKDFLRHSKSWLLAAEKKGLITSYTLPNSSKPLYKKSELIKLLKCRR